MNQKERELRRSRGLYWDAAWKLVEGCTKVSPGCINCWSEQETAMRCGHPNETISERAKEVSILGVAPRGQLAKWGFRGSILYREDNLDLPLRKKSPTVFAIWNDLFHKDVPDAFRDRAYAVMALCPQHTFLILTKRAQRMAAYWGHPDRLCDIYLAAANMGHGRDLIEKDFSFPFINIWHGVSCENQDMADLRIPSLLAVPGKRFLSIEPMLSAIDLSAFMGRSVVLPGDRIEPYNFGIDAVLLGGESGNGSRPMHADWVRQIRRRCADVGIPFTFKQWGEWLPLDQCDNLSPRIDEYMTATLCGIEVYRVGKKKAGRLLDGEAYQCLPWDKEKP